MIQSSKVESREQRKARQSGQKCNHVTVGCKPHSQTVPVPVRFEGQNQREGIEHLVLAHLTRNALAS